ncbi:major facilitator superfamily domain-containing protein [Pisolithus albus]|nr:major facilitator superfamily domain-containing protein [Pisolithus albus]
MPTSEKSVQCDKVQYAPTFQDSDSREDRGITRKVDFGLLPILTLLYLLSFLDRSNIGNAKLFTFNQDLDISASAYNTALAIYFVGYVIFEVPSNVDHYPRLKRFDPQLWLPSLTLTWGIVSICQGLVKHQAGPFGIRFLLGATEAGLFPGVVYVFSVYYQRQALAGAFGGIFAYAIGLMNGVGGRKGWQWIFILEGILTVVISLIAYFLGPTWSHKAKFVRVHKHVNMTHLPTPDHIAHRGRACVHLLDRLRVDSDAGTSQWSSVKQAFGDHLVWAYAFLFHGFSFVLYSLSFFLPTIIADLGFATWQAQLMTVPPNALASISIWGAVWLSSRWNLRASFIIGAALVPIIECSGQTKRAVAVALQITIGDIAAIAGCLIYRPSLSAHLYRKPNLIAIGYLLFAILATWRRQMLLAEGTVDCCESEQDKVRLGDRSIHYTYQL